MCFCLLSLSLLSIFFFLLSYLPTWYQSKVEGEIDLPCCIYLPCRRLFALLPALPCRRSRPWRYSATSRRCYLPPPWGYSAPPWRYSAPRRCYLPQLFRAAQTPLWGYSAPPWRYSAPPRRCSAPRRCYLPQLFRAAQTLFRAAPRRCYLPYHATARSLVRPPLFRHEAGLRPVAYSIVLRSQPYLDEAGLHAGLHPVRRRNSSLPCRCWSSVLLPPDLYPAERNRHRFTCFWLHAGSAADTSAPPVPLHSTWLTLLPYRHPKMLLSPLSLQSCPGNPGNTRLWVHWPSQLTHSMGPIMGHGDAPSSSFSTPMVFGITWLIPRQRNRTRHTRLESVVCSWLISSVATQIMEPLSMTHPAHALWLKLDMMYANKSNVSQTVRLYEELFACRQGTRTL